MITDNLQELINEKAILAKVLATAQMNFDRLISAGSIEALNAPIFEGKEGMKRFASNDSERKIAIEYALSHDPDLVSAAITLQECKRAYAETSETLECAMLMLKYETAKLNVSVK